MGKVVDKLLPDMVASALDLSLKLRGITAVHPEKREQLAAQLARHYRLLLAGDRLAELEESYHTVASTIGGIGEDTRLSISIGSVVMRSILRAGARRMIWRPFEFVKCGMTMGSLFSFDVSIALHPQI